MNIMETKEILIQCTIEGNVVKLPEIQLERTVYLDVKKQFELIGGKWKSGKIKGFVFPDNPSGLLSRMVNDGNRDLKKEYQFFETPAHLADWLVELAEIRSGDTILEPSAGRGAIVKAIHRKYPTMNVFGYELMDINQSFLSGLDNFRLLGSDFLQECNIPFDIIIANPPFSKNQDIDHINQMFRHLKPGGRLVSIASEHWQFAQGRKEEAFRKWIKEVKADVYDVESGEFKESGTMVGTCAIVIKN